jgi:hypothetical protein
MKNSESKKIDLYQSFIGQDQKKRISSLAIPFDASINNENDAREYECFKKIYSTRKLNEKPWGMLSWKFEIKCLISIDEFIEFANEKFDNGYECVFINPMIGNEGLYKNVWEQGALYHKGLDKIVEFLSIKIPNFNTNLYGENVFSFCNYFVAKFGFATK